MAHYEPPHQDLRSLQIQLFSSLVHVVKELTIETKIIELANTLEPDEAALNGLRSSSRYSLFANAQYDIA